MTSVGGFRDLPDPEVSYASEFGSILDMFYNPYLARSTRYDRIAGYFSSTIYLLTWPAMEQFILNNDGRIRMICSPKLQVRDIEAIRSGALTEGDFGLQAELEELLTNKETSGPTRLLACLVANKRLHLKVARWGPDADHLYQSMWHAKVGIFYDRYDNAISFTGSMNETFLALSPKGNAESIDVSLSWAEGRDAQRVKGYVERFGHLFSGQVPGATVTDLPEDVETDLIEIGLEVTLEDALKTVVSRPSSAPSPSPRRPVLRQHQQDALEAWKEAGHKGILEHATGAGKTISGLTVADLAMSHNLRPIVIVPTTELLDQWSDEAVTHFRMPVEKCGGGNSAWSRHARLEHLLTDAQPRLIVAVLPTATSDKFRGILRRYAESVALIVDEVHRIGAPIGRAFLTTVPAAWRLGLSATPERFGDPDGTSVLMHYFGGTVHRYTLQDAIRDGHLVTYRYHPYFVALTDDEQEQYDKLTRRISALVAMDTEGEHAESVNRLAQQRALIGKRAVNKTAQIVRIVEEQYREGERWLVYCADRQQLNEVVRALADAGHRPTAYHDNIPGDRGQVLRLFELNGGILVAIKCLDEGVDIPNATHALIAASSQNPREFIQRRGRVLRTDPKDPYKRATVIDVLVRPRTLPGVTDVPRLLEAEIARAIEFAKTAENRTEVNSQLLAVLQDYGLDAASLLLEGIEHDD